MNANITYRKHNGKWEYRVRFKDPITNKYRERSKRGFRTKPEAKRAAEMVQREIQDGYDYTSMPLKDYLDFWLKEYKEGSVRKNTLLSLKNSIDNHIKPYFKNILLRDVTPELYQRFLNHLYDEGYSMNTRKNIHQAFFGAMDRAVINKSITSNPADGAILKGEVKKDGLKFIDSSQVGRFLTEAYEYGYVHWIFYKTLIETGMRKGEAAALQWPNINFKEMTITIEKTLDFQANTPDELFGDPKTYHSKRTITMGKSLADALKFHVQFQNQNKLALKERYHHDLNLVLCRNDGNFMPKSTLFNSFSRILKRAGLPKLPIHSLRHTHAVLLLEAGADMKYIQERLGHGSMRITSDVYSHVSNKIEEENTARFDKYFEDILQ